MASQKEQQSSPPKSPKSDQKRNSQLGVQDPKHESYLAAAKQAHQQKLPKDVKDLSVKFADLFKEGLAIQEDEVKPVIPYYSDLKTNKFAVLTNEDNLAIEDPFNKAIAAFTAATDEGEVFRFKDPGIKKEAEPLLDELSIYIHKLKKANFEYKVEGGTGSRSALFKQVNNFVADLYWEETCQITHSLIPKDLLSKYLDKKINVTKKMTYDHRRLLYAHIVQFNDGEHKDRMANAYCHLIAEAARIGISLNASYFHLNFISREKRFTPTLTMLSIKGYLPDVKIKKYKSLFLSGEQENIRESVIEKAESKLQELLKTAVTSDNLQKVLKDLKKIKSGVEEDLLSSEIKKVRKERLLIASRLKNSHRGKSSFSLSRAVSNSLTDNQVREAFNPFRLPFAEGTIETAPGQAITCITFNEDTGFYQYIQNEYNDKLDNGKVKAIALEFVAFLEK